MQVCVAAVQLAINTVALDDVNVKKKLELN